MQWTGNIQNCNAGTTSLAYRQAVINRVNYFRNMAGIPSVTLSTQSNVNQQNAALMMSANGQLSHSPPSSWTCYTSEGASGASGSNLALGVDGPNAIDLYVSDPGSNNAIVGHRRWILFPSQSTMNTGDVPGANSLSVFDWGASRPQNPEFVAWPPPGYVPYSLLPGSNRWSFSFPYASFTNTAITIKNLTTGADIPLTIESKDGGPGDNTIVWQPQGFNYGVPSADTSYLVTLTNVGANSTIRNFSYMITIINPN
jgi:hypothetical protein